MMATGRRLDCNYFGQVSMAYRMVKTLYTSKWLTSRAEFLQNVCKSQHIFKSLTVSPVNVLTSLNKMNSGRSL